MAEQGGARLAWPDAAKGLGVLLVGLGHSRLLPEWASAWIYSFHMPLFFLLSGWFFSLRPGGVGATLRHKALPILMPYLAYNLAFFCWESAAALAAGGGPDWDGTAGHRPAVAGYPLGRAGLVLPRPLCGGMPVCPAAARSGGEGKQTAPRRAAGGGGGVDLRPAGRGQTALACGRRGAAAALSGPGPPGPALAGETSRLCLQRGTNDTVGPGVFGANLLFTAFNRNLGPTRIDYNLRYLNEFFTCYAAGACGAAFCVLLCRALPAARGLRFWGNTAPPTMPWGGLAPTWPSGLWSASRPSQAGACWRSTWRGWF